MTKNIEIKLVGNLIIGETTYGKNKPLILISHGSDRQGIIEFVHHDEGYTLYLWYDEGKFPKKFETIGDDEFNSRKRLKIIGVDEL